MSTLTVVIASHNEPDLPNTLESIRATAGNAPSVIVVDDCSIRSPILTPAAGQCTLIRTKRRIGVGPARTLGALHATGDYLLFTDAHMRFTAGWYEAAMERIVDREKTLHCGSCFDFGKPEKPYWGARWNMYGQDPNNPRLKQVFECVWANRAGEDDYPIAAPMGACYFFPRAWFLEINPLQFLKKWAGDEQAMSLKCWLSGGEVRLLTSVKIAHKFRHTGPMPYRVNPADSIYNKLFLIHTILPPERATVLVSKFPRDRFTREAVARIEIDWGLIETERELNRKLFTVRFESFLEQFGISFPDK